MQAALITGQETVELMEFPEPTPHDDGAVVEIDRCGICGTDIHAYQSGRPYNPAICGHEWTGTVSAVGRNLTRFAEGDRVVCAVPPACGTCEQCLHGQTSYCQQSFLVATGRDANAPVHGGFAPRIAAHGSRLIAVNPELTIDQAAQVEPTTIAFHAVRHTPPVLGDVTVVMGAGPIGLSTLQFVRAAGAGEIIVIEPNESRRALATELGATATADLDDATDLVAERTSGLGADVVYECVGRPETVQGAVDHARRGGRMCLIGLAEKPATIIPAVWLVKEIKTSAALAYTHDDFDRAMGMIADGRIRLEPLHTSTVSLTAMAEAVADLASGASTETKVLVDPQA